jgi:cytochrome c553
MCATALADAGANSSPDDPRIASAWRVLRIVDCARCHGKTYDGLAAPSIVNYAATQNRETFVRMVLDGELTRGMPGYRTSAYVAENIDDIYRYFLARANGEIGPDYRATAPIER